MFNSLKTLLVDEMNINEKDIVLDAELINDLGFNSLELADLVVLCEDHFNLTFDEKDLPNLVTIRDVVNYLELNAESLE
ncbi:MAG: phosphopantetheine-binding protein [Eubacteriales bacterium]|mgnify:CR=1 FL=1|nr:phosphopantetheine-binding protein [Eubacteriales bacterium]MDD4475338.1 phosphopantetheine-binding protein [Eubacteriales bacterium]